MRQWFPCTRSPFTPWYAHPSPRCYRHRLLMMQLPLLWRILRTPSPLWRYLESHAPYLWLLDRTPGHPPSHVPEPGLSPGPASPMWGPGAFTAGSRQELRSLGGCISLHSGARPSSKPGGRPRKQEARGDFRAGRRTLSAWRPSYWSIFQSSPSLPRQGLQTPLRCLCGVRG